MACTQSGNGYWLVGQDGGIFNFGDAVFYGALGRSGYTDIIGISPAWHATAATATGSFAPMAAPMTIIARHLGGGEAGSAVIASATTGSDNGFWEVTTGGAIFSYGNAGYHGGAPAGHTPWVGMARGPSATGGYWLLDNTGAIFTFGDAVFHGGANF